MSTDPQQHYTGPQGRDYHFGKRGLPPAAVPWVSRLRAEKFAAWIAPEHAVIEIGVGSGWNLAELRCRRKVGVDVSDFLADTVRAAGIEFLSSSVELPAASFDMVVCHHALEHVPHPLESLAEMRRLLKPGGRLIVHVPFEKESRYRRFDPAEPNHHLYSWNVQTLGNLLLDAGFGLQTIGLNRYGYDRAAAALAVRLGVGERGFRFIRAIALALIPFHEVAAVALQK